MLKEIVRFCQGVLKIQLCGESPERFLNLCRMRKICVWNIGIQKNQYCFYMDKEDYRDLKQIARKTKTIPKILEKSGLPFYVNRWKMRLAFWAGFLLFFALLYLFSLFIWDIDIKGQYTHTKEDMLRFLADSGVTAGMLVRDVDCMELEEKIRLKYVDIGWVSAQIDGCHMIVEIKETNMPSLYEPHEDPVHLIADKEGVVESIVMRKGTPMVKAGDSVKAGDILISGIVDVIGDNDVLLHKDAVVADGDVVIRTEYEYSDQLDLVYEGKDYTGRNHYRMRFCWDEIGFSFVRPDAYFTPFQLYDSLSESWRLGPVRCYLDQDREYQKAQKKYPTKKAEAILLKKIQVYLKKIEEKGVIIEENNVKIAKSGSRMIAKGTLKVLEPATVFREVQESEWRSLDTDEHNGDYH